ncbi:hypothetical protein Tco_1173202 [Tanacetum coccineum]
MSLMKIILRTCLQMKRQQIIKVGIPLFSHTDLTSPEIIINPLSGNPTPISKPVTKSSSSPIITSVEESDLIWEEFEAYLASDSFPPGNDDLPFDIEYDLREIEYVLNHDPTKKMDSILEDSVDEGNLADPNNDLVDTIPEMFIDEHTLDYASPPLYDDVDDDLVQIESDNDNVYDDPFDSKEDKNKESKLLIDEPDPPRSSDFLPSPKCDSVLYEDFSEVDDLPSTNNEDKVFNLGIHIHENLFEVTIRVTPDKNVKNLSSSNACLILEDFNPPLYELPFHKEVPGSETLLSFSSENEEKNFNPGFQNPFYLKKAQQLEPMLYVGDIIQKTNPIVIPDSEETLTLAEESRSKMLLKHKDNMMQEKIKQIDTTLIDYVALNKLYKDFETRFVPQTELSAEQAFWKHNSVSSSEPDLFDRPTNVEVPKELPKVSMVNTSLKKLKYHLANFDVVVKERTTPTAITEGTWGFEHTKACFRDEIIPFVKALKDLFSTFNQQLVDELAEVQNVFYQMEQAVEQHRSVENSNLNACLQEKVLVITTLKDELRKLKGKDLAKYEVTHHPSDPEINTEPITPKLLNKGHHSAYIKHTQEEAAVLKDIVDHIKANYPLDPTLESACKYTKLIQELLTKINKTCPSLNNSGEQLVAVTPMNKVKRVRFIKPVTSSRNTITKKASTSNLASNKPMLSSTGVKPSTNASRSQPLGNTKKDRILQTQSSTQKNKVEVHPRNVKSSLKNNDHVVARKGSAHVQHSKHNANFEIKCVKCNGCMLSDNHDLFLWGGGFS